MKKPTSDASYSSNCIEPLPEDALRDLPVLSDAGLELRKVFRFRQLGIINITDIGSAPVFAASPLGRSLRSMVVYFETVTHVFGHGGDQPTGPQQNFTAWECITTVPQGKERGVTCCPKGWKRYQEKCYYLSTDVMSWAESVQNCTGMGSHLVVINSEEEQVFLTNELRQNSGLNYYIGLTAQEVGKWQWVDQTPLNENAAFWRRGEPSNVVVEPCVLIHTSSDSHNWIDSRCEKHYRICEVAALSFLERPSS
ncbi:C-type lectin domain family 4 member E-like [Pluvialis apricaria]